MCGCICVRVCVCVWGDKCRKLFSIPKADLLAHFIVPGSLQQRKWYVFDFHCSLWKMYSDWGQSEVAPSENSKKNPTGSSTVKWPDQGQAERIDGTSLLQWCHRKTTTSDMLCLFVFVCFVNPIKTTTEKMGLDTASQEQTCHWMWC